MNIEDIKEGDYLISISNGYIFYVGEKCVIDEIYFDLSFYETYVVVNNSNDMSALYTLRDLHMYFNTISDHRKLLIDSLL